MRLGSIIFHKEQDPPVPIDMCVTHFGTFSALEFTVGSGSRVTLIVDSSDVATIIHSLERALSGWPAKPVTSEALA